MIISHNHKYLFIELPRTASTAISKELRENYDGVSILEKHATYRDFLKQANSEEKNYFVFSGIRNPLSDAVSLYFKYKTNHKKQFTDRTRLAKNRKLSKFIALQRFSFVQESDADFPTYFKKFYKIPYNNWSSLAHKDFDFVIRFENLQEDFATVLELIGIEQKRALPIVNKTRKEKENYLSYYTPDIIERAKRIFGPFMKEWGYEFPPQWGDTSIPWWIQMEFRFFNIFRHLYWNYLR